MLIKPLFAFTLAILLTPVVQTQQSSTNVTTTANSALSTLAPTSTLLAPSVNVTSPSPDYQEASLPLHTTIDPAFGVLGALLVITGLLLAFIGHRSRWLICLLSGFYAFALVTLCVILRVGVSRSLDDPNQTLKGIYLLACICAGSIGGAAFVIFRNGGLLISSALGGFACSLYLQAFKSNGLIQPIGLRYILYVGLGTLSFCFACHSKLQAYLLIFSSALVGATATILGIDCFTRADLKEFYIRNLGFDDLFERKYPKEFAHHRWFLSTASIIELGVIGGLTLMAISFQGKMWAEFRASLQLMRYDDEERRMQAKAKRAAKKIFATAQKDLRDWEERHGHRKTATRPEVEIQEDDFTIHPNPSLELVQHGRTGSVMSLLPLKSPDIDLRAIDLQPSLTYEPTLAESMGLHIPVTSETRSPRLGARSSVEPLTAEQQTLLDEIASIRKSIDVLRSASPGTLALDGSSNYQPTSPLEAAKRASSASLMGRSRDEMTSRTPSPWLTKNRTRSRSISGMKQDSTPVEHHLFAGSDPVSTYQAAPSSDYVYKSEFDDVTRPASVMMMKSKTSTNEGRARSGSESRLLQSNMNLSASTKVKEQKRKSIDYLGAKGESTRGRNGTSSPGARGVLVNRVIVESVEDGSARFARALNREEPKEKGLTRRTSEPVTPVEQGRRGTTLTLSELQARHDSHLKALQNPTSKRIEEEANLFKAKEEWTLRSKMEKNRFEAIQKQQPALSEVDIERPRASGRRKSMVSPTLSPLASAQTTLSFDQLPKQSGISRAKEWRKSFVLDSGLKEQPMAHHHTYQQHESMRSRRSTQAQPLLHLSEETIRERRETTGAAK